MTQADIHSLYQQYGAIVHRRCRHLVGDEQEAYDLMQEVFLRLVEHHESFRGEASPLTWLYRVSTNLSLNRIRDHRSRAAKLLAPDPSAASLPGMSAFSSVDPERRGMVNALLERVDEETRAIVVHYYVDEMTLDEIAGVVGLSVPTLRKRIQGFHGVARRAVGAGFALLCVGGTGLSALLRLAQLAVSLWSFTLEVPFRSVLESAVRSWV